MKSTHYAIIIPGLADDARLYQWAVNHWKNKYKIIPYVVSFQWKDKKVSFEEKLNSLILLITSFVNDKRKVSLIGISAGASAAINAYCELKELGVEIGGGIVNICGRVREGNWVFPSLTYSLKEFPSYISSVLHCEEREKNLSEKDRKKIVTYRGLIDEMVPPSTIPLEGVKNYRIPTIGHIFSIIAIGLFHSKYITNFLHKVSSIE